MAAFLLPGGMEWWIILAIVLLLFGPKQLPKLAKMVGKSMRSLREGIEDKGEDEEEESSSAKPKAVKAQTPENEAPVETAAPEDEGESEEE